MLDFAVIGRFPAPHIAYFPQFFALELRFFAETVV
jgi:hypothetical protein